MIKPHLGDGEAYVEGRSEETARKLFEAADKAGIDTALIFTTSHGYVVPKELVAKKGKKGVTADEKPEAAKEPDTTPDSDEAVNTPDPEEEGEFDPAEHTVAEVKEHLASADDAERDRVLALESKSESPRQGVLKLGEGDK
jgi:hypothetical protein